MYDLGELYSLNILQNPFLVKAFFAKNALARENACANALGPQNKTAQDSPLPGRNKKKPCPIIPQFPVSGKSGTGNGDGARPAMSGKSLSPEPYSYFADFFPFAGFFAGAVFAAGFASAFFAGAGFAAGFASAFFAGAVFAAGFASAFFAGAGFAAGLASAFFADAETTFFEEAAEDFTFFFSGFFAAAGTGFFSTGAESAETSIPILPIWSTI